MGPTLAFYFRQLGPDRPAFGSGRGNNCLSAKEARSNRNVEKSVVKKLRLSQKKNDCLASTEAAIDEGRSAQVPLLSASHPRYHYDTDIWHQNIPHYTADLVWIKQCGQPSPSHVGQPAFYGKVSAWFPGGQGRTQTLLRKQCKTYVPWVSGQHQLFHKTPLRPCNGGTSLARIGSALWRPWCKPAATVPGTCQHQSSATRLGC